VYLAAAYCNHYLFYKIVIRDTEIN
jgi:hypothetical protein